MQFASVGTQTDSAQGRAQITAAADNVPKAGSVTQSSNASSGVTADTMSVTVSTYEGQLRYELTYIDSNNASRTFDSNNIEVLARGSGEGYKSVELKDENDDGAYYIDIYTNYTDDSETDYLAGGLWVYVPSPENTGDSVEFGAFAGGSDPFEQSNLAAMSGDARYVGAAEGVYSNTTEEITASFSADVTLTAEFGNASELGTISGKIDDIHVDGSYVEGYPEVTLGSANIGASNSGFFTGVTSGIYDGNQFDGKWGGQFFGNGDVASDPPGSVVGTFGGATSVGKESFVGVFGAIYD